MTAYARVFSLDDPSANLPLTILLDSEHRTRIWIEGMQLGMADLVKSRINHPDD